MKTRNKEAFNEKYKNAEKWLILNGFVITYNNHPNSLIREFHFIKDQIRINLFIGTKDETYYCTINAPIDKYNTSPSSVYFSTHSYIPGDNSIFKAHKAIKSYLELIDSCNNTNTSNTSVNKDYSSKQTMWEIWFVFSCIFFVMMLFLGTADNSKFLIPHWPYFMGIASINLGICIFKGITTKY